MRARAAGMAPVYPPSPWALALPLLAACAASCGGASPDSGIEAALRLSGAGVQYVPGTLLDDPAAVGPAVHGISASGHIFPGAVGRSITGSVETGSSAVLLGLVGDIGHYIVPVTGMDVDNPPDLQFSAQASLAKTIPAGANLIRARAVGTDGSIGPAEAQGLTVDAQAVTGNRSSLPPRTPLEGGAYTDDELATAGVLDFDSNSQCVIDGLLAENVSWQVPPPSGHYIVRMDAFSMCGQGAAHWAVSITEGGVPAGTYVGVATDADTRFAHGAGAGINVVEFDL
jgi:hypothetical protein